MAKHYKKMQEVVAVISEPERDKESERQVRAEKARGYVKLLNDELSKTMGNRVIIGQYLADMNAAGLYFDLKNSDGVQYNSIYEMAEDLFGLKKTTVKEYLGINSKFVRNGKIASGFCEFSYCQLVELLPVPENLYGEFNVYMTVREMRKKKKDLGIGRTSDKKESISGSDSGDEEGEVFQDGERLGFTVSDFLDSLAAFYSDLLANNPYDRKDDIGKAYAGGAELVYNFVVKVLGKNMEG